jgi:hypothetical protein
LGPAIYTGREFVMDKINVVWASYHKPDIIARGYWDQGMLEDIFAMDGPYEVVHYNSTEEVPNGEGALFIINGRTHTEDAGRINSDIAKLAWCIFIETGDEEALFPWRDIKHPLMAVWLMLPRMNQHDDVAFHLPNGYRPDTRKLLKEIGRKERDMDVFFAGQVTHERRVQCAEELIKLTRATAYRVLVVPTQSFGEEKLPYKEYLSAMARSKIVLCPSGPESPDNFRLYEALEAGCIPIVDAFSTNHKHPGFWKYLLGDDMPIPEVQYWDELPQIVPGLVENYDVISAEISIWWQFYKRNMRNKLYDTIKEFNR